MKTAIHSLTVILLTGAVCLLTACSTDKAVRISMADASVPRSGQCLIAVLNDEGNWAVTMLVSIDDSKLNVPSSIFYIPSGLHTLNFKTTTSSFEDSDFEYKHDRTEYVRTTYTDTSNLQITETFLPKHTYRMVMRNASNIKIEDITGSVNWLPPKVSLFSPRNGVLTNFANPRGFYLIPVLNAGPYFQYNHQFEGTEALIASFSTTDDKIYYAEKGFTGLSPVIAGAFFQGGLDLGIKQIGLTLMAEINGGIAFGNGVKGLDFELIGLNCGYLFVGELYYLNAIGFGFGYGKTNILPSATTVRDERPVYDYLFPYFRGEVLFFPKTVIPITIYADYFFDYEKWAFGILANFSHKRERLFYSNMLQ